MGYDNPRRRLVDAVLLCDLSSPPAPQSGAAISASRPLPPKNEIEQRYRTPPWCARRLRRRRNFTRRRTVAQVWRLAARTSAFSHRANPARKRRAAQN